MTSQSSLSARRSAPNGPDKGNSPPARRTVSSELLRGPWALLAVAFLASGCGVVGVEPFRSPADAFAAGLALGLALALPLMRWGAREARETIAYAAREDLERLRAVVRTFRRWVRDFPATRLSDPATFERLQEAEAALLELDILTRARPSRWRLWREERPAPEPQRAASWELASLGPLPVSDRWARRCRDEERGR